MAYGTQAFAKTFTAEVGSIGQIENVIQGIRLSNQIFASRSIQLAYGTLNGIYLSISNPSTYEQTIDVVFKATGSHILTAPAGTAGADGVTCPDNKTCKNKLAFRRVERPALARFRSGAISVEVPLTGTNQSGNNFVHEQEIFFFVSDNVKPPCFSD